MSGGDAGSHAPVKPGVAGVLSVLVPGLGHIYAGRTRRAYMILFNEIGLSFLLAVTMWLTRWVGIVVVIFILAPLWWITVTLDSVRIARSTRSRNVPPTKTPATYVLFILATFVFSNVAFALTRSQLIQAFRVPAGSMMPTLLAGDYVMVDKRAYVDGDPQVDDLVVFRKPDDSGQSFLQRCVAVAGDTVAIRSDTLFVNSKPRVGGYERFEGRPRPDSRNWPAGGRTYVVPPDHFFVLGDSRWNSDDSRYFGIRTREAAVPNSFALGKLMFIYLSFDPDRGYALRSERVGLQFR